MSQLPLHPMIVHFPIALACLLPLVLLGFAIAHFRGAGSKRTWLIPLGLQAVVFFSAWFALQLGERDEERFEQIVAEQRIEAHEEAGKNFVLASGVLLVLMALPLLWGARLLPALLALLSLASVAFVYQAGHSGASLVHSPTSRASLAGPGTAPTPGEGTAADPFVPNSGEEEEEDDD